jgi:hypothetical protein
MKILVTGITKTRSGGAPATLIYKIFEKCTSSDNYYNIIDDITDCHWSIDKRDAIVIENEIPKIEYDPDCYIESEEYYNNVSATFLDNFTLNSYNKLTGKEHLTDEEFFNKYLKNNKGDSFDWKISIKNFFGDRVDIQNDFFIVYFPIKHVQNSSGRQHTIYDVYLKVIVTETNTFNKKYSPYFYQYFEEFLKKDSFDSCFTLTSGTRTRVSDEEYSSLYNFSHFQRGFGEWRNTCLGEGLLSAYKTIPICNEEHVISYCVALENYLSWESLEGGPYIKISDIKSNIEKETLSYSAFYKTMIPSLISNMFKDLILDINENTISINYSALDEVNSFYAINKNYISINKLNQNDKNTNSTTKTIGNDFFVFNEKKVGKLTIDSSLNKTSSETIFSGELDVYKYHYFQLKDDLINQINIIINDKSNNFLEKKPLFRIN